MFIDGFCFLHLSKNCTTCLFISKSFQRTLLYGFLCESGCKGKDFFLTTKTFSKFFFKKFFFESVRFKSSSLFSISTHLRFSLESGCTITALQHILQTNTRLFYHIPAKFSLNGWLSKHAVEHLFQATAREPKPFYLKFIRARMNDGITLKIWWQKDCKRYRTFATNN